MFPSISLQIFEAEQDNLYVEPISAGRAVIAALLDSLRTVLCLTPDAAALTTVATTAVTATKASALAFLAELLSPVLLQAATLFGDLLQGADGTPTSYQANLFQYFYLCFTLSTRLLALTDSLDSQNSGEFKALRDAVQKVSALLSSTSSNMVQHPWITAELSKVQKK